MKNDDLQLFVALSAALSGISKEILAPEVTNFDLAEHYFKASEQRYGEAFQTLLHEFGQLLSANENATAEEAVKQILQQTALGDMARQIIFLWYMGAWAVETDFGTQTRNLDAISYQKGMVWQVMQSHPMGYTLSRYGYWAHKPGDLEAYIGKTQNSGKGW